MIIITMGVNTRRSPIIIHLSNRMMSLFDIMMKMEMDMFVDLLHFRRLK